MAASPVFVGLAVLACYRLAQLVAVDDGPARVFHRVRVKSSGTRFADFLACPWCVGIYFALVLALLLRPANATAFVLLWFGIAGGQAFLETVGGERE